MSVKPAINAIIGNESPLLTLQTTSQRIKDLQGPTIIVISFLYLTNVQNPKPRLRYDFFLESLYRTLNTIVQNFLRFIFKPAILVKLDLV